MLIRQCSNNSCNNIGIGLNGYLDLTKFNSVATNLYLTIFSTIELEGAVGQISTQISGLVKTNLFFRAKGIYCKYFFRFFFIADIPPAYTYAGNPYFSFYSYRTQLHELVDNIDVEILYRLSDRNTF